LRRVLLVGMERRQEDPMAEVDLGHRVASFAAVAGDATGFAERLEPAAAPIAAPLL
jgi:hypothetical protein